MGKETLEEARANSYIDFAKSNEDVSAYSFVAGWDKGAKWQQEKMYSEEEVLNQLNILMSLPSSTLDRFIDENGNITMKWFELFKNK
jgi:hypothetical protein